MALQQRTVIGDITLKSNGNIDVQELKEIYDSETNETIATTPHRYIIADGDEAPQSVLDRLSVFGV